MRSGLLRASWLDPKPIPHQALRLIQRRYREPVPNGPHLPRHRHRMAVSLARHRIRREGRPIARAPPRAPLSRRAITPAANQATVEVGSRRAEEAASQLTKDAGSQARAEAGTPRPTR